MQAPKPMITFCPLADVEAIARLLDDVRLNAQRTEAWVILRWLRNPDRYSRFVASDTCSMWASSLDALAVYYNAMLREWLRRGGKTVKCKLEESVVGREDQVQFPGWWGNDQLHHCHRIALLCKDPEHYGQFFSEPVPGDRFYDYVWPSWDEASATWIMRPNRLGGKRRAGRKVKAKGKAKAKLKGRGIKNIRKTGVVNKSRGKRSSATSKKVGKQARNNGSSEASKNVKNQPRNKMPSASKKAQSKRLSKASKKVGNQARNKRSSSEASKKAPKKAKAVRKTVSELRLFRPAAKTETGRPVAAFKLLNPAKAALPIDLDD